MAESAIAVVFFLVTSVYLWLMVLSPSLRRKFGQRGLLSWFRNKDKDVEGWDALLFVVYLACAILFSLLTLAFIFLGFARVVDR